jgi:hypothetical protein
LLPSYGKPRPARRTIPVNNRGLGLSLDRLTPCACSWRRTTIVAPICGLSNRNFLRLCLVQTNSSSEELPRMSLGPQSNHSRSWPSLGISRNTRSAYSLSSQEPKGFMGLCEPQQCPSNSVLQCRRDPLGYESTKTGSSYREPGCSAVADGDLHRAERGRAANITMYHRGVG